MTKQDPERRTAREQRDSGGADEAQKSAGAKSRKTVPSTPASSRRRGS
jgi:hypothetical protein